MIAIIFIGTSKYKNFFEGYYEGINKNFLVNKEKHFFIFTDDIEDPVFNKKNVIKTKIEHQKWPYITLYRFKFIRIVEEQLSKYDYVFFIDADLWCVDEVTEQEVMCENKKALIGVQHPGFVGKIGTFETNTMSHASIFDGYYDVSLYRQGCFWGGKTPQFLEMIKKLDENIDDDLKNNIVAIWHDESHMNKYFLLNNDIVKTLHPGFAQPQNGYEEVRKSYPTKFIHLDKDMKEFPRFSGVR